MVSTTKISNRLNSGSAAAYDWGQSAQGGNLAKDLFYLASYKNVGKLFETILTAKAPAAFTVAFLNDTIGLKSTTDRALINMLKKLGFLDTAGVPTPTYSLLKNKDTAKAAIAEGLKKAYEPLFEANEKANELPMEQLKGLVSQVTGGEQNIVNNVAWTFNAIVKAADFTKAVPKKTTPGDPASPVIPALPDELRKEFHFNIQVHLPANGTEETYLNIFNALRRTFS